MEKSKIKFEKYIGKEDYSYFSCLVFNEQVMNMNMGRVFTEEEAVNYFGFMINNSENYKIFIENSDISRIYIGTATLRLNENESEAEIEYMLLPDYWGKGYGTDIVGSLINLAKNKKNIKELIAITDPNNIGSQKVLIKNGFESFRIYKVEENDRLAEIFKKNI